MRMVENPTGFFENTFINNLGNSKLNYLGDLKNWCIFKKLILCSGIRRILTLFWSVCLVRVGRLGKTVPSVSSWFALFALLFVQNLTQFDIHFPDNVGRLGNKNTLIAKLQFYLISSLCLQYVLNLKLNEMYTQRSNFRCIIW